MRKIILKSTIRMDCFSFDIINVPDEYHRSSRRRDTASHINVRYEGFNRAIRKSLWSISR